MRRDAVIKWMHMKAHTRELRTEKKRRESWTHWRWIHRAAAVNSRLQKVHFPRGDVQHLVATLMHLNWLLPCWTILLHIILLQMFFGATLGYHHGWKWLIASVFYFQFEPRKTCIHNKEFLSFWSSVAREDTPPDVITVTLFLTASKKKSRFLLRWTSSTCKICRHCFWNKHYFRGQIGSEWGSDVPDMSSYISKMLFFFFFSSVSLCVECAKTCSVFPTQASE